MLIGVDCIRPFWPAVALREYVVNKCLNLNHCVWLSICTLVLIMAWWQRRDYVPPIELFCDGLYAETCSQTVGKTVAVICG